MLEAQENAVAFRVVKAQAETWCFAAVIKPILKSTKLSDWTVLWDSSSLSYHYVYRRQASQQVVWSQQRRNKRVPDNGTGGRANKSQALWAQGLKALWVTHVTFRVLCRGVSWCPEGFTAVGPPLWWRQGAWSTCAQHGVQEGLDPVGGALGEVAEQHGCVSA